MVTESQIAAAENKIGRSGAPPPSTGRANAMPLIDYSDGHQTEAVPAKNSMSRVFTGLAGAAVLVSGVYLGVSPQKARYDDMHVIASFLGSMFQSNATVEAVPSAFYSADGNCLDAKSSDENCRSAQRQTLALNN